MDLKHNDEIILKNAVYPKGVFSVCEVTDKGAKCYPKGGGFQKLIPMSKIDSDFLKVEETPKATFVAGEFGIEDSPSYAGYDAGFRWNGWRTPLFDKETSKRILSEAKGWDWGYDDRTDTFIYAFEEQGDKGVIMSSEVCKAKGCDIEVEDKTVHVYAIGDGWIWEKDEEGAGPTYDEVEIDGRITRLAKR